ncbi:MAG: hypothetical protein WHS88_03670 [Anaerohalosphaeraceae bacterium]
MKKFVWKLQQLLTLKEKQENALRADIVTLTEQTMVVKGRIRAMQMRLRAHQQEIRSLPEEQRIAAQSLYAQQAPVADTVIRQLTEQARALEQQRRRKLDDYLQVRKFRKGLERLREKARQRYQYEMLLEEQKQADDYTHLNWNRPAAATA